MKYQQKLTFKKLWNNVISIQLLDAVLFGLGAVLILLYNYNVGYVLAGIAVLKLVLWFVLVATQPFTE